MNPGKRILCWLGLVEPETTTVNFWVGGNNRCEVTFITNTEKKRQTAEFFRKNGYDFWQEAEKNNGYQKSKELLKIERAYGLKRHSRKIDDYIIPAFQIGFGGSNGGGWFDCEYWHRGFRSYVNNVHHFEANKHGHVQNVLDYEGDREDVLQSFRDGCRAVYEVLPQWPSIPANKLACH